MGKLLSVHLTLFAIILFLPVVCVHCCALVLNSGCKLLSVHLTLFPISLFLPVVCPLLCTGAEFSM